MGNSNPRIKILGTDVSEAWLSHKKKWGDCRKCGLCNDRYKLCLFRGQLPCDLLFIGEAPGESEDIEGFPFVGPAGRLLDELLDNTLHSLAGYTRLIRVGYSNLCCCIPKKADPVVKFHGVRPPSKEEIKACRPRLMELIKLANPRLVVCLGEITHKGFMKTNSLNWKFAFLQLTHPSAILQSDNRSRQEIRKKRFYLDLREALELVL